MNDLLVMQVLKRNQKEETEETEETHQIEAEEHPDDTAERANKRSSTDAEAGRNHLEPSSHHSLPATFLLNGPLARRS